MTADDVIGLRGQRGRLTVTAAAELVAIDLLRACSSALADGAPVDGRMVREHLDRLRVGDDDRLADAARRVQVTHVLKVAQAWCGGIAKSRRAGRQ